MTYLDGSTNLGTQVLSGGAATLTVNGLASGSHTITVSYSGDTNFIASSATAFVVVNAGTSSTDFTFGVTGGSKQTTAAGATATYTFTLNPVSGTSYPGDVKFTVTGLPATVTATFSPTLVTANAGRQSVTLTVKNTNTASARVATYLVPVVVCLMLPFAIRRRKVAISLLWAILAFLPLSLFPTGCTSSSHEYVVTVTAAGGATQHSAKVSLVTQ